MTACPKCVIDNMKVTAMKTKLFAALAAAALLALGGCAAQPNSQAIGKTGGDTINTMGGGTLGGSGFGIGGAATGGMNSRR